MDLTLIAIGWVACGVIGSAVMLASYRLEQDAEITVGDLLTAGGIALFGPFNLLLTIIFCGPRIIRRCINLERVVFPPPGPSPPKSCPE